MQSTSRRIARRAMTRISHHSLSAQEKGRTKHGKGRPGATTRRREYALRPLIHAQMNANFLSVNRVSNLREPVHVENVKNAFCRLCNQPHASET